MRSQHLRRRQPRMQVAVDGAAKVYAHRFETLFAVDRKP
jgi:hypothetical protein